MKKCQVEGCFNPVFTHGYCYYHRGHHYRKKDRPRKVMPADNKLSQIKQQLKKTNNNRCFFTGRKAHDLLHILRRSGEPQLREEAAYLVLATREIHKIFDDGTHDEIMAIPNIEWALEIMRSADEKYYYRFIEFKHLKSK